MNKPSDRQYNPPAQPGHLAEGKAFLGTRPDGGVTQLAHKLKYRMEGKRTRRPPPIGQTLSEPLNWVTKKGKK